ncbi:MAG: DUF2249 domain-containing protein [Hahellaceae bacterium]|nr:DUF2249 domain-containing protein [Hahellaceae bacterium]MCP5168776.1 DUF2249 domain-containing protein [Hahellaceae bacterium]
MTIATRIELDVSALAPPEPLDRALDALAVLNRGEYLAFLHYREPFPLYQTAAEGGFRHRVLERDDGKFEIRFWYADDDAVTAEFESL